MTFCRHCEDNGVRCGADYCAAADPAKPYTLDACRHCWNRLSRHPPRPPRPAARPSPCRHLGPETGDTVRCETCPRHPALKLFTCAVHGDCTPQTPAPGHASCPTCPDYSPLPRAQPAGAGGPPPAGAAAAPGAGAVRHLLYHVYPHRGHEARWRLNLERLKRRLSLFNGRRVVGVAVGPETFPASAVRDALAGCGCDFVEAGNDPGLREGATLPALHGAVSGFTGPGHATLYAHAKGITSPGARRGWEVGVPLWRDALYETCLDHWPAVQRLLATHPVAGPFKRPGRHFPESRRSDWHYSGSWRWFRNADFFARDWRQMERHWCAAETHPSLVFRRGEAACLAHEFAEPGLALYTAEWWRDRAGPALAAWREEHLADRWTPLLLTCVLTSHEKPDYVHDAVGSVLAQTSPDWQLLVMDSGELAGRGEFGRYRTDPRVRVELTGETAELRARVGMQGWAVNECFRRGLVLGDLVCHLSDDDVLDPGVFDAWLSAARAHPGQDAWLCPAVRTEVRGSGEVKVGDLPAHPAGTDLDCKADGMQACHRTRLRVPWPEDKAGSWHADGAWLRALGRATTIHPLAHPAGRHRATPASTFTRPAVV